MQADPLQHLRDVHLPQAPSWWPPAPGWWLLALLGLLIGAGLIYYLRSWLRLRAPFESALRIHKHLRIALNNQTISVEDYLHRANGLLKRVFIHGQQDAYAASLSGQAWLQYLDGYVEGKPFSSGAGVLLSEVRFANNAAAAAGPQLQELQRHIDAVLKKARSRPRQHIRAESQ